MYESVFLLSICGLLTQYLSRDWPKSGCVLYSDTSGFRRFSDQSRGASYIWGRLIFGKIRYEPLDCCKGKVNANLHRTVSKRISVFDRNLGCKVCSNVH